MLTEFPPSGKFPQSWVHRCYILYSTIHFTEYTSFYREYSMCKAWLAHLSKLYSNILTKYGRTLFSLPEKCSNTEFTHLPLSFFFEPPTFENIFWKNCPNKIQDEKNKLIRKIIFSCIEEHKTTLNGFYEQHL